MWLNKLFNIEQNIINLEKYNPKYKKLLNQDLIHLKFRSFTLKQIEYTFVQYFMQYEYFRFQDIKYFAYIYFRNYYFSNDIIRHLVGYVSEKIEGTEDFRLKDMDFVGYFESDHLDITTFVSEKKGLE